MLHQLATHHCKSVPISNCRPLTLRTMPSIGSHGEQSQRLPGYVRHDDHGEYLLSGFHNLEQRLRIHPFKDPYTHAHARKGIIIQRVIKCRFKLDWVSLRQAQWLTEPCECLQLVKFTTFWLQQTLLNLLATLASNLMNIFFFWSDICTV